MAKIEITYQVVEVVRYRIQRHFKSDGAGTIHSGIDFGSDYGEFDNRNAAEAVRDALERAVESKMRTAI